jgi:hypothetical protein
LPPRFVKIRHHGLMSAAHATTRLEIARQLLTAAPEAPTAGIDRITALESAATHRWRDIVELLTGVDLGTCPRCGGRNLEREPLARGSRESRGPPKAA